MSAVEQSTARGATAAPDDRAEVSAPRLVVEGLHRTFTRAGGERVPAIDDVSFEIDPGEFIVLLGPSGCGKTTLLRCIAGLEDADSGRIALDGRDVVGGTARAPVAPEDRRLGMVFQAYALWPHMTVSDNIAYPLRARGTPRAAVRERVADTLRAMSIDDLGGQYPGQLSGGQQQRVALARAIVSGEGVLLFDEPLSNVDAKVRDHLRREILTLQRRLGFTAVYVTHDQQEAMALATRVAVLRRGRIEQFAPPRDIYTRPRSRYVAEFVGIANLLEGRIVDRDGEDVVVDSPRFGRLRAHAGDGVTATGEVLVVARPEHWTIAATGSAGAPADGVTGIVTVAAYAGTHTEHTVDVDGAEIVVWSPADQVHDVGAEVVLGAPRTGLTAVTP